VIASRVEDLKKGSSNEDLQAAIEWVAGMPPPLHMALVSEISLKTGRNEASLKTRLTAVSKKRSATEYPRLKLKSYLLSKGGQGREEGGALIIPDPFIEGDEIIVRDAVLLGHKPIIEKSTGYAHPIDDYIKKLIGDDDTSEFMVPEADIKSQAAALQNPDTARDISPRLLSTANVRAFEAVLGGGDRNAARLLITLRLNQRYAAVDQNGQIIIFDLVTRQSYTRPEFTAKLAPEKELVCPAIGRS
jgi:hypothetical protein